jgi:DDE family transposase
MDMAYVHEAVYAECEQRGCHPILPCARPPPSRPANTARPSASTGEWTFAGADAKRWAAKWRCPTGECSPASRWIGASRLHTLIPQQTPRWKKLYRQRGAVEREFGRLKNEWALLPLRVRRIERVRLHADLTILAPAGDRPRQART